MDLERNGQYSDSESVASDCSSNDEDKIHVGSEYQANVPNNVLDKSFCYLELDKSDSVWLPSKINFTNEELDQYLKHAYYTYNICEEQALSLLHTCCYDLNKARVTLTQTKCVEDTLDKWSHQEREHFINAYNYHGKKFKLIQASLPNKSISDLVDYYYTWKKTRNSVSLITQYCNVLALQHSNTLPEETLVDKSPIPPLSPPISLDVQDAGSLDQMTPPSTQTSGLDVNTECPSSQSSGLDVNINCPSSQSSGVDVALDCPSSQDSGFGVNINCPSSQNSGLSLNIDCPSSQNSGLSLNIDCPSSQNSGLSLNIDCPSTRNSELDSIDCPSSQNSGLGVNIDSIEPSILHQDLTLSTDNAVMDIAGTSTPPVLPELPLSFPTVPDLTSPSAANVLNLKDLVPEHLAYLLECLESNEDNEHNVDDAKVNTEDETGTKVSSNQINSMFARCSSCKNILDTWTFSSTQGIVCYACKPSEQAVGNTDPGVEGSTEGAKLPPVPEGPEGVSSLDRLNEVCKQTCDPDNETDPQCNSKVKHHKLKLVPRGLHFDIVDYIEIATNKPEYVDNVFKRMDRDISNLVKKVRSNNISMDAMLDQIDSKLPLDKYRSTNNNNTTSQDNEDKVGVLWTDMEIFLVLQGFLKYGMDFETIAEILETKTYKQVDYFYQVNKSYYDLDVLIREHNSNKQSTDNKVSKEEKMEVDICK
ncbi:hypothetical protein M8J75_012159 [Diaphorina citri]|nr:hypothetical protein M8J75_012159 [Diaphorina citri]